VRFRLKMVSTAAVAAFFFALQAHGVEGRQKAAGPLGKVLGQAQNKKASGASQAAPKTAPPSLPSFVIPRDTCEQGEPLQALPLAKP